MDYEKIEASKGKGMMIMILILAFHIPIYPYAADFLNNAMIWAATTDGFQWFYHVLHALFAWPTNFLKHTALFIFELTTLLLGIWLVVSTFKFLKGDQKAKNGNEETPSKLPLKERLRRIIIRLILWITVTAVVLAGLLGIATWIDRSQMQNVYAVSEKMEEMSVNKQFGSATVTFNLGEPVVITNRALGGEKYEMSVKLSRVKTCDNVLTGLFYTFDFDTADDFMIVYSVKAGDKNYKVWNSKRGSLPRRDGRIEQCEKIIAEGLPITAIYEISVSHR